MADRAKFLDFLDMIDGGGAGQRGNQFEGGGIFSMLANLMPINPYGSEDKTRREARDEFFAEQGITPQQAAATPAVIRALQYDAGPITQNMRPQVRPQPNFPNYAPPSASSMPQRSFPNNAPPSVSSMPQRSFPNYAPPSAAVGSGRGTMGMPVPLQGSGRGTMNMPMPPQNQVEPRPSVMSEGPALPTSKGVPMGPQPQMQTSMVGTTGFEEGDMRGRIDGTISGGVTPSVLGSPSLRQPPMEAQPMTFEEFAQQQSILPNVGLDQLRSLYENYLSFIRRNNTIGNLTR